MPDNNSISGTPISESLKNVQTGLTAQTSVQATQQAMLFNPTTGLPAGKAPLRGDTIMLDQYSGKTIKEALAYIAPVADNEQLVDMGLPSGLLWAKANIDITTDSGFQEVEGDVSPFKYECSFCSWGNTDIYNPMSDKSYVIGSNSNSFNYNFGTSYDSSPGGTLTANLGPSFDAARANLGAPWRIPTNNEFIELVDNCDFVDADGNVVTASTSVAGTDADKRITMNGIIGIRLRSKINGNTLFFPACGYGSNGIWNERGQQIKYPSSVFGSSSYCRGLLFTETIAQKDYSMTRNRGYAIRPVQ